MRIEEALEKGKGINYHPTVFFSREPFLLKPFPYISSCPSIIPRLSLDTILTRCASNMCVHFKCIYSLACLSIFRRNDVYDDRIISFHAAMNGHHIYLPLKWSVIDFSHLLYFGTFSPYYKGKLALKNYLIIQKPTMRSSQFPLTPIWNFLSDREPHSTINFSFLQELSRK